MMRVSMAWKKLVMSDLFKGISCKIGYSCPNFWGFLLIKGLQPCKSWKVCSQVVSKSRPSLTKGIDSKFSNFDMIINIDGKKIRKAFNSIPGRKFCMNDLMKGNLT
ncbi:unnamed protein product [Lathyrus sativus]|nr:unnamed protein product [Lathyrus sativus]